MVSVRPFIFHIYIPCGKTLSLVPKSRSSVKLMHRYQGHSSRKKMAVVKICTCMTNRSHMSLIVGPNQQENNQVIYS